MGDTLVKFFVQHPALFIMGLLALDLMGLAWVVSRIEWSKEESPSE